MWAVIKATVTKEIASGVELCVQDFVDVPQAEMATALRGMVRSAYNSDDAGYDYNYDEKEGVVCIGEQPGWWDSRNPVHVQLLKVADMLDGKDYSFVYTPDPEQEKKMTHPCEYCGDNEGHTNSRYMLDDNGEGSWVCAACEEQFDALAHEFDDDLDQVYGD